MIVLVALSCIFTWKKAYAKGYQESNRLSAVDSIAIALAALESSGVIEKYVDDDGNEAIRAGKGILTIDD